MLVRKRSSHLQTFVREQPQKTGALFHATLNFGGAGWRQLMLALPIVRSLFTCKLLSVTCPKWTRESVRPLSLSGSLWVSLGLCGPLWSSFGFSGTLWACLGLSGLETFILHVSNNYFTIKLPPDGFPVSSGRVRNSTFSYS